ncbi:MAG TPA: glycosyltransferase [Candidatus Deferrimicrobiaceae bacterium]|nr:glycosyltransferase [Candidatus Deferrimicrobiaceae bacterium]
MHRDAARAAKITEQGTCPKPHVLTLTPFYPSDGDEVSGCFVAEALREIELQGAASSVIAVDSIYHAGRKSSRRFPAHWIRYPQLPGNLGLASAGRFLGAVLLKRIRNIHRHSPVSVIHAHAALPCGDAAAFLSRHLEIPFVVTVHGLDAFNRCFQDGIAARWRRTSSAHVYSSAGKVICVSEKVQRVLQDGMAAAGATAESEIVYNGTDPEFFAPKHNHSDRQTILVVGNLLAGKGHELVLRALAGLKHSHPGLQCEIIGEGADRVRFERLAQDLDISARVHFLGRRSRTEVADAMRNCTIFVLPSRYEGLGCVYLEAMACGKAAIACHGQGIEEIIRHGENGWLIPIDGMEELVQGLRVLLGNADLRARIGNAARLTILDNLTMSHQAGKLMRIYEEAAR